MISNHIIDTSIIVSTDSGVIVNADKKYQKHNNIPSQKVTLMNNDMNKDKSDVKEVDSIVLSTTLSVRNRKGNLSLTSLPVALYNSSNKNVVNAGVVTPVEPKSDIDEDACTVNDKVHYDPAINGDTMNEPIVAPQVVNNNNIPSLTACSSLHQEMVTINPSSQAHESDADEARY